jgi:streptogramin lyase
MRSVARCAAALGLTFVACSTVLSHPGSSAEAAPAAGTAGVVSILGGNTCNPREIVSGPDGALWYTNSCNNSIGRITTAGSVSIFENRHINHPQGSSPDRMEHCGSRAWVLTPSGGSPLRESSRSSQ